jgi:hypothetical protein
MTCIHQKEREGLPEGLIQCESPSILSPYVPATTCSICPFHSDKQPKSIRGVGDVIEKVVSSIGIRKKKGCGCGSAQAKLNRIIPFSTSRADRSWAAVVTTAPRPECTLHQCVNSLRVAGWEPVIFAEPDSYVVEDAETIINKKKLGVWHNWVHACEWAMKHTKADRILTVQDDALFHPDSKTFTDSILWPSADAGFISLYTPKHYNQVNGTDRPVGVNRVRTRSLWGACALVWPRNILRQVLDHKVAKSWMGARPRSGSKSVMESRGKNPALVQNSDTAIGKIINRMRREMWFVDPSPVQHVGTVSTVGHGGNQGRRNCGRCADFKQSLEHQVPKLPPERIVAIL